MRRVIFKILMCATMATSTLTGCLESNDVFNPNASKEKFEKAWQEVLGSIDPQQDWNAAGQLSVIVGIPYLNGGVTVSAYTAHPLEEGSRMMYRTNLTNGSGNFTMDAPKALDKVFVAIEQEGLYRTYGYYAVTNGTVNVTPNSQMALTKAASDVTRGETKEIGLNASTWDIQGYSFNGQLYSYEELIQLVKDRGNYYYTAPFSNCIAQDEYGAPIGWDFSNAILDESLAIPSTGTFPISVTYLNGVEKSAANPWIVEQGGEMFGPGSPLEEDKAYYTSPKYGELYDLAGMEQLEAGFSIVSKGGEIALPFIYGGTNRINQIGYIYYKEGQDPLTQPHYILMNDASPENNLFCDSWNGGSIRGMDLPTWVDQKLNLSTKIYGTTYKLSFFGENHDQTATYDFPAGYKVVFFIYPQASDLATFNYSVPELNKRISHYYWNQSSPNFMSGCDGSHAHYEWDHSDICRGSVKAASWTFNGMTFAGFEDGTDEDLNDIVFWIEGAYELEPKPLDIGHSTAETEPAPQSWILACEDLGNADDFDFNDIVLSVSYTGGTTATITPLAAGGTLPAEIYYNGTSLGEIHALFGVDETDMVNTNGKQKEAQPISITVPADFTMSVPDMGGISIKVTGKNNGEITIASPDAGTAPQMICVPDIWMWPTERTSILSAYNRFKGWMEDHTSNLDWYTTPETGKVVQ